MGGFRSLFGLSKSSSSKQPPSDLPSLSDEITKLPEQWQGNLPCVHGATDGCLKHNPAQTAIFFDSALFGPAASKIKPSGNTKSDDPPEPDHVIPTISSDLPQTPDALAMIPRVHKYVPYSLSFYHIHAAMSDPSTVPSLPGCRATTGSNPSLSWEVKPYVQHTNSDPDSKTSGSLLLEYSLAFVVKADLGSWSESTQHGRAISKEMLIGSGYRDFTPCAHTHVAFTSHRGEGKDHTRYAGINLTTKIQKPESSKFQEEKVEWRSEIDEPITPLYCSKCYTDVHVDVSMIPGGAVVACVTIYKDLGEGKHWADEKWLSLARGVDLKAPRGEADFGRMKKAFVDAGLSL
ncbi:hypothetical protein V8F20_006453 [Naviculisporaceae sp. PSN 640]